MLKIFQKYFKRLGYHKPTLIQQRIYQPMSNGRDVVGLSPTGSGKTVAFLLPTLPRVKRGAGTQLLILEPSQELAIQTTHVARNWAQLLRLRTTSLTGGANFRRQKERLKKHPEVIVGTPGRVQVLVRDHKLKLGHLKIAIIDEADDLLSGSTLEIVRSILNAGPSRVQIGYFSATDTQILHQLKRWFAKPAERIDVRKLDHTRGPVVHGLFEVGRRKRNKMLKLFCRIPHFRALVFFDNLKTMNRTYSFFRHLHFKSVAKLAGYQGSIPRQKAMRGFRKGSVKLLLTTEMAARGLDIQKLPAVINYDLPRTAVEYVHRSGRTGRMGNAGLVINFGDDHDLRNLKHLLTKFGYRFQHIYFYSNQIMNRTELNTALAHRKLHLKSKAKKPRFRRRVKRRYRRKHKHSKNKGMRHKWRMADRK